MHLQNVCNQHMLTLIILHIIEPAVQGNINPIKPAVSYFLRPLNYQHNQNFAENLLYAIYFMPSVI